jgi:hypothetical protein
MRFAIWPFIIDKHHAHVQCKITIEVNAVEIKGNTRTDFYKISVGEDYGS